MTDNNTRRLAVTRVRGMTHTAVRRGRHRLRNPITAPCLLILNPFGPTIT